MKHTNKFTCEVVNQADNNAEIHIYGYIGKYEDIDYKGFQNIFRQTLSKNKEVIIRIHSGGGSVYEGLAIYDLMRSSDSHITTIVEGMAASMASVIALGGDEIQMTENAFFMMHAPSGGAWGDKATVKSMADQLEQCENRLFSIYKERTKAEDSEITSWFTPNQDTWLDAENCGRLAICDQIIKPVKKRQFETTDMEAKTEEDLFAAYAGELPKNKQNKNMNEEIINLLKQAGISLKATSEAGIIQELSIVAEKANKADEVSAKLQGITETNAKNLVENALKAGKITAAEKEEWLQDAKDNYELTAKALDRMAGKPSFDGVKKPPREPEANHELLKGREGWTLDDWREKDPKGLTRMENEAPEELEKLYNQKFNK